MLSNKENYNTDNKTRIVFYLLWLSGSILQASFSNLIPDEAYYWKYSQELARGYFDHPPVIAVMIKMGYVLFKSELGVRLLSIFAMTGTIYITERLTKPKNVSLFYLSMAAIGLLHITGILAVPDLPLLFFTACFFLLYKQYEDKDNIKNVLLLSVNIALLLLSKYHGILVIFFTLLSNLQMIRRRSFWLIVLLSLLLFSPHILWQYQHDFPSIKYHLFGRNQYHYDILFTVNYLLAAILIFAPATGIVLLYFALRSKVTDVLSKALQYNLIGGLIFFFLMSFKGRVEGNWIFYLMIPVLCLGYPALESKLWHQRFIRISFSISITLIFIARLVLINDIWSIKSSSTAWNDLAKKMQKTEYIGWAAWADTIKAHAHNAPVAFINSYQKAAEYEFYSGEKAFTLNNIMGRKDQYNIWNYEDRYQGKTVFLITNFYLDSLQKFETNKDIFQYAFITPFYSSSNIEINASANEITTKPGDSTTIQLSFRKRAGCTVDAEGNPGYPMHITYQLFNRNGFYSHTITGLRLDNKILNGENGLELRLKTPPDKGDFSLFISVSAGWLPASINSNSIMLHNK